MGVFVGALFGLSFSQVVIQIFKVPYQLHGWEFSEWELKTLQFPAGIWIFLLTLSISFGWRRYRREKGLIRLETES
jgi:hypothetical protein